MTTGLNRRTLNNDRHRVCDRLGVRGGQGVEVRCRVTAQFFRGRFLCVRAWQAQCEHSATSNNTLTTVWTCCNKQPLTTVWTCCNKQQHNGTVWTCCNKPQHPDNSVNMLQQATTPWQQCEHAATRNNTMAQCEHAATSTNTLTTVWISCNKQQHPDYSVNMLQQATTAWHQCGQSATSNNSLTPVWTICNKQQPDNMATVGVLNHSRPRPVSYVLHTLQPVKHNIHIRVKHTSPNP